MKNGDGVLCPSPLRLRCLALLLDLACQHRVVLVVHDKNRGSERGSGRAGEFNLDNRVGDFGRVGVVGDKERDVHAETEIDGKHYSVCYLRNADCMGDFRIAVNFIPNSLCFSEDDTFEYLQKCRQSNNTRPIFLYGTLDCMDEAKIPSFLEELATLNRQVFISACQKIQHEMIQNENINLPSMGVPYNECQTVVLCPVCGNKTLDCHAICPHCNWQNDGLPEDQYSAANGSTLAEYRTEYLKRKENE